MDSLEFEQANQQAQARRTQEPMAVAAHYDRRIHRLIVSLNLGFDVAFLPQTLQGLESARPTDLDTIEISPSGFGFHFPKIDADLYLPALLQGIFGSQAWMAAQLEKQDGQVPNSARTAARQVNGKPGGRPRKLAA